MCILETGKNIVPLPSICVYHHIHSVIGQQNKVASSASKDDADNSEQSSARSVIDSLMSCGLAPLNINNVF